MDEDNFDVSPEAARADITSRAASDAVRMEWFLKEVSDKITLTLHERVKLATEYVRSKVVKNISKPVSKKRVRVKSTGRTYTRRYNRSKPGQYPRADTTLLMKTIFTDVVRLSDSVSDGRVGTPLDYGLTLELLKNRSFLVRTLYAEKRNIERLITGPIT